MPPPQSQHRTLTLNLNLTVTLTRNINLASENVTVTDVSAATTVLAVMGPQSRELLERLTLTPLDNDAFPFGSFQEPNPNPNPLGLVPGPLHCSRPN